MKTKQQDVKDMLLINNLQQLMGIKGINEASLSRQTKIPQPTLHKVLSGKTIDPRISTLKLLADYFAVTVDSLYSQELVYQGRQKPQGEAIPVLSWKTCINWSKQNAEQEPKQAEHWIYFENTQTQNLFALKSKPSMEPTFHQGSLLIISCDQQRKDGDFVIVHYPNTNEATLRQLYVDGPDQRLLPLNNKTASGDTLDGEKVILGKLIQSRFNYEITREQLV